LKLSRVSADTSLVRWLKSDQPFDLMAVRPRLRLG
jgi:hypothetical protein